MKRVYIQDDNGWKVILTNGKKGLRVTIEGCENKTIAAQQAKDRIRELKKAKLI